MKSLIVANENTSLSIPIGNFRNNVHHKHVWDTFKQTIVELLFAVFGEKSVPDNTIDFIIGMITDGYSTFSISDIQDAFVKCARMTDTRIYNGQVSVSQVTDILDKYNELYKIPKLEQENRSVSQRDIFLIEAPKRSFNSILENIESICANIKRLTILLKRQDDLPVTSDMDYKFLYAAIVQRYNLEVTEQQIEKYRDMAKIHISNQIDIVYKREDDNELGIAISSRQRDRNDPEKIRRVAALLFIRDFIFLNF